MNPRALSAAALVAALPLALPAQSMRSLSQGDAVRKLWKPVVATANRSVVEVCVDERAMVLGTVVGKDLVVTKLSELTSRTAKAGQPVELSIDQGDASWPCVQVAFDRPSDLALLRVEGAKLVPVQWAEQEPKPGAFLASVDGSDKPFGVGILAAAPYVHTRPRAFLGIRFANPNGGIAKIDEAVAHGAAKAAGIRGGDVVVAFDGEEIDDTDALRAAIRRQKPGDKIEVVVLRDAERVTFQVELGTNSSPMRSNQESVWGELSEVRSGFQRVLQHDTVLKPEDCGGPVIGLDGRCVGVNVARAGRIETLAIPAREVRELVGRVGKG
ncbi:MAG: PDZ domain-containing protein [Planctomycetota bacterium]